MKWTIAVVVLLVLCGCSSTQENKNKVRVEALGIDYEKTTPGFVVVGDSYETKDTVKKKQ